MRQCTSGRPIPFDRQGRRCDFSDACRIRQNSGRTLSVESTHREEDTERRKEECEKLAGPITETHAQGDSQNGSAPGLSFVKPEVTPGEPLKLEISSFIESVRTRRPPRVTAQQGRAALELALTIQAQMEAHAERAGLGDFFKSSL